MSGNTPDSPAPQLPSPTDDLPPELLEDIQDANDLLLDLALSDDRSIDETYQKVFDGLSDLSVQVIDQSGNAIEGKVILAGFDFVVLEGEASNIILPYPNIKKVLPAGRFAEPFPALDLLDASSGCKRELAFRFGETVASSPELIHLFFRIRLAVYLLTLEKLPIEVITEDDTFQGTLGYVSKETICLATEAKEIEIPIGRIRLIRVVY
ncbi:hypothetical protein OXB_0372 [Bacillus sp. OxB-1]|uniref:hypothetical protein n=1 Tax=Bacillus sp. (strain OxB-1) TaxID=98228 RepID=UPI000582374A|nr:hypothetical protein [Bacillus sp. OxB-1]BAQ08844.1 hypothetical protein OXB_0372 [Bacillus sp. OxB-1]